MDSGRPLRDVFAELLEDESARQAYAADPTGFLESYGHADLPPSLVAEAIVNFADTATPTVAEYLAPFVMAHATPQIGDVEPPADTEHVLDVLAAAPPGLAADSTGHDGKAGALDEVLEVDMGPASQAPQAPDASLVDLDFGGGGPGVAPSMQTYEDTEAPPVPEVESESASQDELSETGIIEMAFPADDFDDEPGEVGEVGAIE